MLGIVELVTVMVALCIACLELREGSVTLNEDSQPW